MRHDVTRDRRKERREVNLDRRKSVVEVIESVAGSINHKRVRTTMHDQSSRKRRRNYHPSSLNPVLYCASTDLSSSRNMILDVCHTKRAIDALVELEQLLTADDWHRRGGPVIVVDGGPE